MVARLNFVCQRYNKKCNSIPSCNGPGTDFQHKQTIITIHTNKANTLFPGSLRVYTKWKFRFSFRPKTWLYDNFLSKEGNGDITRTRGTEVLKILSSNGQEISHCLFDSFQLELKLYCFRITIDGTLFSADRKSVV